MRKRNWMGIAVFLLMMSALLTASSATGTMARYTATASGTVNANVAKFQVTINDTSLSENDAVAYFYHGKNMSGASSSTAGGTASTNYDTTAKSKTFTVTNHSEVAVRVTPRVTDHASYVTFSPAYADLAPGATSSNFTMRFATPLTGTNGAANMHTVQLICNFTQID